MSDRRYMDAFRANVAAAEIPASESDIESVIADGYLERVAAFRSDAASLDLGDEPDYPASWSPMSGPGVASAASSGADAGAPGRPPGGLGSAAGSELAPHSAGTHGTREPAAGLATISEASAAVRSREVSPAELAAAALERIVARDEALNAFQTVLADEAMEAARAAEAEIAGGSYRGPLHGIPVAAKDLLAMTGTVTTAGSKVFAERVTDFDAAVIERLRGAGAVIVGKTRLSEFAYWPGSTNPHYGPTPNPHAADRDAGGSSSGSGVAVADGMVFAALGSDTGGSIRIPAALCGVVGLKPTFGRVSLFGCAPLSWSLDHLGALTRTVADAALFLEAVAGPDARDPRTRAGTEFHATADLDSGAAGLRVGVPADVGVGVSMAESAMRAWERSNQALEARGAELVEVDLPNVEVLRRVSGLILAVEASGFHAPILRSHHDDYGTFCRGRLLGALAFTAQDFLQAQRLRRRIRREWDRLWDRIDVLSTPAQPDVAPPLDRPASTDFTNPFNVLGWPAITVPYGEGRDGLPLATQLVARPWAESTLLRAARALEEAR